MDHSFQPSKISIACLISLACVRLSPPHKNHRSTLNVVHAMAGADVDAHLAHTRSYRLHIAWIAECEAINSCSDTSPGLSVFEAQKPSIKRGGLEDLAHDNNVNDSSQHVNRG
jgi:hypothetical protein